MTIAVLLILLALWLAVLAPPAIRFFTGEARRADSVDNFNEALSVLGRTNGRRGSRENVPESGRNAMTPAQRRRRDVLLGLLGAFAGSLALALVMGGPLLWGIQVVVDALVVGYVLLLVRFRQQTAERQTKVRYLPDRSPDDELALRRVMSGR